MNFQDKIKSLRRTIEETLVPLISKKCLLLDLPYYSNVGDILIWEGTNEFLKKCSCTCLYKSSLEHYRSFKCSNDVTILLQGGGNFGDIWRLHQDFRLKVISEYPNNRIIILPQSVFYENEKIFGSVSVRIDSNRYVSRLRWSERWRYVFRRS